MALGFSATVLRSYMLDQRRVLVLETGYEGDVESGDWIEVTQPAGDSARAEVATVAWGSAFHADDPPLTLVVKGLGEFDPETGATIRGIDDPAS